jgi:hypothetical protein
MQSALRYSKKDGKGITSVERQFLTCKDQCKITYSIFLIKLVIRALYITNASKVNAGFGRDYRKGWRSFRLP